MTTRFAAELRTRTQAVGRRVSRASITAQPWSKASIALRNREQAAMLTDVVRRGESVLDVGCGTAELTQCMADMHGAEVMGLDVKDFRVAQVPFREFGGTSIPLPNRSFDHVVLSFALHHSNDPMALIQECRRVARRSILVFEDLPDNRWGRSLVWLHVELFRRFYRLPLPGGDYRAALKWLSDDSVNIEHTAMPYEWFDRLYVPRFLHVYTLPDD